LWAEGERALLVVLQGMDTSGKDGTIRHVFCGVNPLGVRVTPFKAPSEEERKHDFLWRAHRAVPANGEMGLFNRSHYEDVLIVRVHAFVPEPVWRARYDAINDFERHLAEEGTTIVKFWLHISADEQRRRLQARLDDPAKRWKFNPDDLTERKLWPEYRAAAEEMLARTATPEAPWYVVPADHKWYRNWAVSRMLVDTLEEMNPQYPEPKDLGHYEIPDP
jgi:PPK2 family polyphosphate:nucleotide phosphotransferase